MIRTDRFLISKRLYAVDLSSLTAERYTRQDGTPYYCGRIGAVWFRRKQGVTAACIGSLWDFQDGEPTSDPAVFLAAHDDGRHGGDCYGRWDGESYWGTGTLADQEQHLAILRPMLTAYPAIPPGYDGWWRF